MTTKEAEPQAKSAKTANDEETTTPNPPVRMPSSFLVLKPSFIKINSKPKTIDPIAQFALTKLKQNYSVDEKELLKKINDRGWTNYIDNVTKRLNRMNLGHASSHVLAATYEYMLNEILFDSVIYEAGKATRSKKNVSDSKVQDTVGLAQEILFKMEEDGGPLSSFAANLADRVLDKNKINLDADKRNLLISELRAQF